MIPEELMKTVGQAAREARERLEMNQAEVARAAGISPVVYGRIERGQMLPAVPTCYRAA
jgi:DNA-binding XRE family transcriptional regulator